MERHDAVIIGAGPAGLSAAVYARRAGLSALVLEMGVAGGQINLTSEIENYPAVGKVGGMELAGMFRSQAEGFGADFLECSVSSISLGGELAVETSKGTVQAGAIVIASGASHRKAGFKGEEALTGRGVSYCAVCDAPLFQGAEVAVIGGGSTAVAEARYLARFASRVHVIHRRDQFRAPRREVAAMLADPKVHTIMESTVDEVLGGDLVSGLVIRSAKSGDVRELAVDGAFVCVGMEPNVSFIGGAPEIKTADGGWIVTDERMMTSVPGVFAAGDVRDKFLRQVITAAADGAIAGAAAYEYLSSGGI